MEEVALFDYDNTSYVINLSAQRVDEPHRALSKFRSDSIAVGFMWLGAAAIPLILTLVLLIPEPEATLMFRSPVETILEALLIIIGPILTIVFAIWAIKAFRYTNVKPKRETAEETVITFLDSIKKSLWRRAYNCLTDSAQKVGSVDLPVTNYLQEKIHNVRIDSIEDFKRLWSPLNVGFWKDYATNMGYCKFEPLGDTIKSEIIDKDVRKVFLKVRIKWKKDNEWYDENIDIPFIAVERGGFWFLANGFIWPSW